MRRTCLWFIVTAMALVPARAYGQAAETAAMTPSAAGGVRTIEITASDPSAPPPNAKYGYSVTTITATPGERLRVVLKAVGTMPAMASSHNFVLFKPGTKAADITAFVNGAPLAATTGFIPPDKKAMVLANTPMVAAGGTVEVTFTAPTAPGSYTYICSFTAHYAAGMHGTLVVK